MNSPRDVKRTVESVIKRIAIVRRALHLSQFEAASIWIDEHAPLAAQVPGLLQYRVNIAVGANPAVCGIAEMCFSDQRAARAGLGSMSNQLASSAQRFSSGHSADYFVEHVIAGPTIDAAEA